MDPNPTRFLVMAFLAATICFAAPTLSQSMILQKPRGPNVVYAWHEPENPNRGEPVTVHARLNSNQNVTDAVLVYCRAESYACAPSVHMQEQEDQFVGLISWHAGFFRNVENVGYNLTLKYADGSQTHSPRAYWPERPAVLPPDAGIYYFYKLKADSANAPGILFAATIIGFFAAIVLRRLAP